MDDITSPNVTGSASTQVALNLGLGTPTTTTSTATTSTATGVTPLAHIVQPGGAVNTNPPATSHNGGAPSRTMGDGQPLASPLVMAGGSGALASSKDRVRLLRVTYPPHPVALRLAHSQSPPQQQQQHTGRHTYQHPQPTTTP
ncbi:Raptor_N domain-containing protein [Pycnococcus provasolii]